MRLTLQGGRVIDPGGGLDEVMDVHIADGRIAGLGGMDFEAEEVVDARGFVVCPGLVDLRARLREPGQEYKATILSETRAAAAGGITTLCCPPDTDPVVDTPAVAELIRKRAKEAGYGRVVPLGALTRGLKGDYLSEMGALKEAGCVGVSHAFAPLVNTKVLKSALEYAATHDLTVFLHPQDPWLKGCVHEGKVSARLGLPGLPASAETAVVARDLVFIREIGVRAHFCQLSTAEAAAMVGEARDRGLPVSADVAAHYLHLTETDVLGFDSRCHVMPPLRTLEDREGLRLGLKRGDIQAVCSDHQPHEADAKTAPFPDTEPGISALETLLPLTLHWAQGEGIPLLEALAFITLRPARILGLDVGTLRPGACADVCLFDPEREWRLEEAAMKSRGKNTPFLGWLFKGKVVGTLYQGRWVYGPHF